MGRDVRHYRQQKRAASTAETRTRILHAALGLFMSRWYDEVSLQEIARTADVSLSTLVRHFATKPALLLALSEAMPAGQVVRDNVRVGDVEDATRGLLKDYENVGDTLLRLLALEGRLPEVSVVLDQGRANHRAWIERVFANGLPARAEERRPIVDDLVVIMDLYSWKLWRRDMKKTSEETLQHMAQLVRLRLGRQ